MSTATTTSGFIRQVEDITTPPTRYQNEVTSGVTTVKEDHVSTEVPNIITLERAIKYFQENAVGELKPLYDYTVSMLRKSLVKEVTQPIKADETL